MKRTPLRRGTGLKRNTASRGRIFPAAGTPASVPVRKTAARKATGFSPAVKLQVRTRAGTGDPHDACCEATGVWLGRYGGEIQHRDARGMGGTSNPVTNSIVNAVLLSKEAHRLAESRDKDMNKRGFWLENGQDPALTPVILFGGVRRWLTPEGGYSDEAPGEVAA